MFEKREVHTMPMDHVNLKANAISRESMKALILWEFGLILPHGSKCFGTLKGTYW